jgi:hypothetical protein
LQSPSIRGAFESIVEDRFSGEPFRVCDVYLDDP